MARTPYRSSSEDPPSSADDRGANADLGALRSSHARIGLAAFSSNLLGDGRGVDVHANGLVVRGKIALPFVSIDAVHFDFESFFARWPALTFVTFDGTHVALPRVESFERVLRVVEHELTSPILDAAQNALRRGERLAFGPLHLTLDGIEFGSPLRKVPWADVVRVQVERAVLVLYGTEPRGRLGWIRLREVPYPTALFAVLRLRTRVDWNECWARVD